MVSSKKEWVGYYLFLAPAFIIFVVFIFGPMIYSFILSFFEYNMMTINEAKFVGFNNFKSLLANKQFLAACKNTLIYTLTTVPIMLVLGFLIASLINSKYVRYKLTYKICYYIPYVSSMVAVVQVFSLIFNASTNGTANQILTKLGLEPIGWLSTSKWAMVIVIILGIWKQLGYVIIIYIGGLLAVPGEVYESASLDPISPFTLARKITLPLIRPTTIFLLVTETINGFQVFTPVQILTDGGPGYSTTTLVTLLYDKGFKEYKMGIASAISLILFLVLLILSIIQNKIGDRE